MNNTKISTRRYGRLLAVLLLNSPIDTSNRDNITTHYRDLLRNYLPKEIVNNPIIEQKICSFAYELISGINSSQNSLINTINKASKNRTWVNFIPLDQILLLIGTFDLTNNSSEPKILIKEILIICDLLKNENAVPYISGILKTIAFGNSSPLLIKKKSKIRLKKNG